MFTWIQDNPIELTKIILICIVFICIVLIGGVYHYKQYTAIKNNKKVLNSIK